MAINTQAINPLHWGVGKLSGAVASMTVNPVKDLISYVYPRLGASLSDRVEIKEGINSPMTQIMGAESISALHAEVKAIAKCGGIGDDVKIYTGINAPYQGNGSVLGHALVIPLEEISKKNFNPQLNDEPFLSNEQLEKLKYDFTDNEIRFQFSRAVGQMKGYSILKICARVIIVALAISLLFSPAGWLGGLIIFAGATILYCSVNRYIEQRSDRRGIKILTKRFEQSGYAPLEASIQATIAARNCLKKIALQNIDKRSESKLCRLILTEKGNFRFDPSKPQITSRIEKLEKRIENLSSYVKKEPAPVKAEPEITEIKDQKYIPEAVANFFGRFNGFWKA